MVLKRMKRRHSRAEALEVVAKLRALRPDMVLGADVVDRLSDGDRRDAAENTYRIVTEADLTYLHVFPFSPRSGTPAARMPQVDGTWRRRALCACANWATSSSSSGQSPAWRDRVRSGRKGGHGAN